MRGFRKQTSYSAFIHDGMSPAGSAPLYSKEKDCQGISPRGVASIVLYMSVAVENGGVSSCVARDAAQRLRMKLMSPADI